MLKRIKLCFLSGAGSTGLSVFLMNSSWRRRRLLILCYHGISLNGEHLWNPDLYMQPSLFRERLAHLRDNRCNVLSLGKGVERLQAGTLPERAVAITFDDGTYDFYRGAFPILEEFGFPVTVYLTTYYAEFNRPVFDPMCSYLLWRGRGRRLDFPEALESAVLLNDGERGKVDQGIKEYALRKGLSGGEKDGLLAALAARLGVDYGEICQRRILHLMTPGEAKEMARAGVDLQMHTHRHRVSRVRDRFLKEIEDNRRVIAAVGESPLEHFCYPGGFHLPEFLGWLRSAGVKSATTTKPGIAAKRTEPLLLPRLVDTTSLTLTEFDAWLSGTAAFLPQRKHLMSSGQLLEGGASK